MEKKMFVSCTCFVNLGSPQITFGNKVKKLFNKSHDNLTFLSKLRRKFILIMSLKCFTFMSDLKIFLDILTFLQGFPLKIQCKNDVIKQRASLHSCLLLRETQ